MVGGTCQDVVWRGSGKDQVSQMLGKPQSLDSDPPYDFFALLSFLLTKCEDHGSIY